MSVGRQEIPPESTSTVAALGPCLYGTRGEMTGGWEWLVDGEQASALALADLGRMRALGDGLVARLGLGVLGQPQWHQFPDPGGVTGLYLLAESHLTVHTFPESGVLTLNLYSCRERTAASRAAVAETLRAMVTEAAAARVVRLATYRRGLEATSAPSPSPDQTAVAS